MSETREFKVAPEDAGTRLDVFLARRMPDWSRSQVQRQIRSGRVTVGAETVYKAGTEVAAGASVAIRAARHELRATPEDLPLDIIYEDGDLVVVNKPAGMVVHVGAGVKSGTLANALLHHIRSLSRAGGELRPGIVHRLDRMTSGLVVAAKTDVAHRALSEQFKAREVHKTYVALVHGRVTGPRGEIERPIGRDPRRRVRMRLGGLAPRQAVTRYRVKERFGNCTLVEAEPITGRTHQIRVHFASLGHPIVGDTMYGAPSRLAAHAGWRFDGQDFSGQAEQKTLTRNFLHAARLEFLHPRTGKRMSFEAPLPSELQEFLDALRRAWARKPSSPSARNFDG
ncbi:MAG: RluA family pseudouridine synthase [Acidobacteria bacterium]|nr:MAG: RluA family pseudouridine synthase [Acidobacteriota bacterium]